MPLSGGITVAIGDVVAVAIGALSLFSGGGDNASYRDARLLCRVRSRATDSSSATMLTGTRKLTDVLLRPGPTGGASTAQAGINAKVPLDDVTVTAVRGWCNTARPGWRSVAKQEAGCCTATEWVGDGLKQGSDEAWNWRHMMED